MYSSVGVHESQSRLRSGQGRRSRLSNSFHLRKDDVYFQMGYGVYLQLAFYNIGVIITEFLSTG